MRIAYFRRMHLPVNSANAINSFKLCQAFAAAGHETTLYVPWYDPSVDLYAHYGVQPCFRIVALPRFWSKLTKGLGLALVLAMRVAVSGSDFIYGRDIYVSGFLSTLGVNHYYDAHGPLKQRGGIHGWLIRRGIGGRSLKGITTVSAALERILREDFTIKAPVRVVRNASHDVHRSPAEAVKRQTDKPIIGYTGGLYKGRGVELMLRIAELLPRVELWIIGGKAAEIEEWRGSVRSGNVTFKGYVAPKNIEAHLKSIDVLLAPYQLNVGFWGGSGDQVRYMSPVKIFEYMSANKPMLVSDLPVIREILTDDEVFFCAPTDAEDWAGKIQGVLNDGAAARRKAQRAYDKFRNHFTWSARVENILILIKGTAQAVNHDS